MLFICRALILHTDVYVGCFGGIIEKLEHSDRCFPLFHSLFLCSSFIDSLKSANPTVLQRSFTDSVKYLKCRNFTLKK